MDANAYLSYPLAVTLGLLAPFLISFLKDVCWPDSTKAILAFVVCVVFGAATAYVSGGTTFENATTSVGIVFTVANLFYKTYFEHTHTNARLEQASIVPAPPAPPVSVAPVSGADQPVTDPIDNNSVTL